MIFYPAVGITAFILIRKSLNKKYLIDYRIQELQEAFNVLASQIDGEQRHARALQAKIIRYKGLKNIMEDISRSLDLNTVADKLTSIAFSSIGDKRGTCILYLLTPQLNLHLFKSRREDPALVIKAKEGDIFDYWVLRHTSPLLIEDARKDFRFDLDKLKPEESRPIASLASAPFLSEHRFLGVLRRDHSDPQFFSQEDLRFLATICDLGAVALENSEMFKRTEELAIHDGLTGLFAKGYFLERFQEELKRSGRKHAPVSLLMLDIDRFKDYNDKFGHAAGDIVLKRISEIIMEFLRNFNAIIGRFGGEEFCIILSGTAKANALTVADQLRERIGKEKLILRREETFITVSIGIASAPEDGTEYEELISKSDKAMYEAKRKGRNRVC